jgi:hypothetical protein
MKNKQNILLEDIGKELPFTVPSDYFDQFALQMDRQIGHRNHYYRILKPWMYIAAVFAGIFIIGGIYYSEKQQNIAKNNENYESYVLSQVDEASVMDYYVNGTTK